MYQNNVKLNYMIFYFKLVPLVIFSFWSLDSISLLQPLY
ncbi:hypothetical protein ACJIZ3_003734 [Penstemon smallii]|uniref:NADH dehydrogenase subunit 1 n=1 Tax=Penstemon smallii TaxID=265156 RepID=A0ABD3T358_9LAMI